MTATAAGATDQEKVWRYMSFARFVWLLQQKRLWLSRADLLGDPWEISLAGEQLAHVIARHPPITLPLPEKEPEDAMEMSRRIIKLWRRQTFVNCWSAASHESHALWRIYCRSDEGVAIQTTFPRLKASIGSTPLFRIVYDTPGSSRKTPTLEDLVTKKRPMFAYEQEVRVVLHVQEAAPDTQGYRLDWDPEEHVQAIKVHPEADASFMDTVVAVVEQYAPKLKVHVAWSAMNAPPPF